MTSIAAVGQTNLHEHKLFRVLRTVYEMMLDRHYDVPEALIAPTYDDFVRMYIREEEVLVERERIHALEGANLHIVRDDANENTVVVRKRVIMRNRMTLPCTRDLSATASSAADAMAAAGDAAAAGKSTALVLFCPPHDLTGKNLQSHVSLAENDGCRLLVLVTPSKPNAIVKKYIDNLNRGPAGGLKVELFEEDDLAVNITRHELVPRHVPLTPEQTREVLQAHALEVHQLPRLLATDPVARYFGLTRGNVVRIERRSESAGVYASYRQVV
ncbi:DNA-directed RNA polymerases I, II, and III subunit RPABC1 [Strigomonas culicis]|uniref:DNA-directed RNA polymerases I, II, and III subunit RPABC1 n=1 Tax=Strigomonas culicis TaxID=28005 RepID=S9UEP8_9TRYP|nr:DNA-directed RNA polymerases I, II, and III subunit RPABC1 [Strigomonas culicis]|eukprot:EPY27408.1 DNA-directed RNA polymerases I, II, and III subunit RPABC1 [Strigomonas culicis]